MLELAFVFHYRVWIQPPTRTRRAPFQVHLHNHEPAPAALLVTRQERLQETTAPEAVLVHQMGNVGREELAGLHTRGGRELVSHPCAGEGKGGSTCRRAHRRRAARLSMCRRDLRAHGRQQQRRQKVGRAKKPKKVEKVDSTSKSKSPFFSGLNRPSVPRVGAFGLPSATSARSQNRARRSRARHSFTADAGAQKRRDRHHVGRRGACSDRANP